MPAWRQVEDGCLYKERGWRPLAAPHPQCRTHTASLPSLLCRLLPLLAPPRSLTSLTSMPAMACCCSTFITTATRPPAVTSASVPGWCLLASRLSTWIADSPRCGLLLGARSSVSSRRVPPREWRAAWLPGESGRQADRSDSTAWATPSGTSLLLMVLVLVLVPLWLELHVHTASDRRTINKQQGGSGRNNSGGKHVRHRGCWLGGNRQPEQEPPAYTSQCVYKQHPHAALSVARASIHRDSPCLLLLLLS